MRTFDIKNAKLGTDICFPECWSLPQSNILYVFKMFLLENASQLLRPYFCWSPPQWNGPEKLGKSLVKQASKNTNIPTLFSAFWLGFMGSGRGS